MTLRLPGKTFEERFTGRASDTTNAVLLREPSGAYANVVDSVADTTFCNLLIETGHLAFYISHALSSMKSTPESKEEINNDRSRG